MSAAPQVGLVVGFRTLCLEVSNQSLKNLKRFFWIDLPPPTFYIVIEGLRPFIDSESNHIRSFIQIPFINKGIDFIDLPSIFQDKSVIQSIPTYFQNSEPPIICYKYNKPIRNTIFNFNKLVSDLDIHANTPKS